MEWTPRPLVEHLREQERHNMMVITVGSKYEVYVQSPASSPMQPFNNPFETLAIKWEVNIFEKKSSCVVSSSVFLLRLSACVFIIESLWYGKWVYNIYIYIYIYIYTKIGMTIRNIDMFLHKDNFIRKYIFFCTKEFYTLQREVKLAGSSFYDLIKTACSILV